MSIYASLEDLIERAGEAEILDTADRDGDGVPDAPVVDAAIQTAGQTIDAYLASRFRLPLVPVPEIVRKWAVSIARYHLHRTGTPDYVVRDWKDATAELRDAAAGRLALPGTAGSEPERSAEGSAIAAGSEPVFTARNLEGWI